MYLFSVNGARWLVCVSDGDEEQVSEVSGVSGVSKVGDLVR